jgi:hypothetical protein
MSRNRRAGRAGEFLRRTVVAGSLAVGGPGRGGAFIGVVV